MNKGSTLVLKGVVALIGIAALALAVLLVIGIMTDRTGYYRPILIGMLVTAVPFYMALWQTLKLLKNIDRENAFSDLSVKSLRIIKYCAIAISAAYALGMPYIFYAADRDDAPGVVAIGLVIIFASFVIATFAAVLDRLLEKAIEMKSENDLTV